jgi:hypothetical protein
MHHTTLTCTDPQTTSTKPSQTVPGSPGESGAVVTQIVAQRSYAMIVNDHGETFQ